MIKHLEKWMYINSIDNEKLKQAWKLIIEKNLEPVILSSKAYILKYFYDLVKNKITVEDFYIVWDVYSDINTELDIFIKNPYDFFEYIKKQKPSNKLYIVDNIFNWFSDRKDIFYI